MAQPNFYSTTHFATKLIARPWSALLLLAAIAWSNSVSHAAEAVPDPNTYIYDLPASAVTGLDPSKKSNWALLTEDDVQHTFAGAPVLSNGRILAVLAEGTGELTLYAFMNGKEGLRPMARLQPVIKGKAELKRKGLTIKENSRGLVSIEVSLAAPTGATAAIAYSLEAGASFVKATATKGVDKLRVEAPCRWAILPDFFGDDMVLDAAEIPLTRTEVPSENFLMHLLPGGDAIVLTVSESRDNDIEVALSSASARQITASDISYGGKPNIWVAVLSGPGVWHEHDVKLDDAGQQLDLEWHMPFPALWRVDWTTADKLTDSWEMLLQDSTGKYLMQGWFGQDEAVGQRFGQEYGARDWNKPNRSRWNPVLGSFSFPCWVDKQGQGHLQPLSSRRYTEKGPVYNFTGPALVYPMDRASAAPFQTPIDSLTIVDLVRMTLGVGPCQYILDLEGQKRNTRGVATCYARDVINALYKQGAQLQNRPVINEHLDLCVAFIKNVRERIDAYVAFGHQMADYLQGQKRLHPEHAAFIDELLQVNQRLDQLFERDKASIRTPQFAKQHADDFRQTLLNYSESDAAEKCAAEMAVFTSIGGAQDGLVASCRMIVKTLRQRSGMAMALDPSLKEIATEVRARTQAILRNPTPYEAPRH